MKPDANFLSAQSSHIETRRKLKEIPRKSSFMELLEESTLSDEDKEIITLHYLKNKDFRYIGDLLGFSESAIKKKHKNALKIIEQII